MPAPIATFIKLPDDSANSGKMIRAESKSISGSTVLEQFTVPVHALTITGNYWISTNANAIVQSAHNGTSTGFFWFQNPVASTVTALLREISVDISANAATVATSAPSISFTKFTFTGTASGSSITSLPYATGTTASQMICRTAVTGMTVTLVAQVSQYTCPAILTAVGSYGESERLTLVESPQAWVRGQSLELAPGEGLVCYQSTGGSATDPRLFGLTLRWLEIDLS